MKFTYLHVKHAPKIIQGVQKIFDQSLITIDVPLETFSKVKKLNKSHLTLILLRLTIMMKMIGK